MKKLSVQAETLNPYILECTPHDMAKKTGNRNRPIANGRGHGLGAGGDSMSDNAVDPAEKQIRDTVNKQRRLIELYQEQRISGKRTHAEVEALNLATEQMCSAISMCDANSKAINKAISELSKSVMFSRMISENIEANSKAATPAQKSNAKSSKAAAKK